LYAEQLGIKSSVHFVGYVNEPVQSNYYATAQFYFSLPESDATSVSLLEAMAYGCVPIVSDIPANREWIEHGKNGIIVGTNTNIVEEIRKIDTEQAFGYNRSIIQLRAIFPESVKSFLKEVNILFE
jgi:glycosyltransferase involved in cell wall biosynthesis